jgi:septal ring factor EnvC (AmiA/AmiB activator)
MLRVLGVAVALTLLALPRVAEAADPLAEAQARVTTAIKAADEAVDAFNAAQSEYYRLEDEISATNRTIDRLRVEQQKLALLARVRAVVAYKGGTNELENLVGEDSVMDAGRRATLLDRANARGNDAMARLTDVTDDLHAQEESLRADLDRQEDALAELKRGQEETQRAVEEAQRAEQELRERLEAEQRAAEFTALVEQARAEARAEARAAFAAAQNETDSGSSAGGSASGGGGGGGGGSAGTIIVRGSWVCPVQGAVSFRNDWGEPRSGGRGHKGTDLFSPLGTPVVAVTGGSVFFQSDPLGGLAAYVNGNDGNTYYYAHLNDYVGGGRSVKSGELIGHVGNTGNASGGVTHLHFEIRPGGPNGEQVNPYPTLASHC